ncbi:MAG: hypothetical protein P8Y49_05770 [Sulfurovaceae bacterium]
MKKSAFIASYIILISLLIVLFHVPLQNLIWSIIIKIFPNHELSNSITVMPLDGEFKLMISTVVFVFFMLIAPVTAITIVKDKLNKKKLLILFILLIFCTVAVAFIEALVYYFYFIYIIAPSHETYLTLLQFPLKEIGIFAFLIVVFGTFFLAKIASKIEVR